MAKQPKGGGISWTEETWNPIRGCSRVSEGCRFCYAERVAARFSGIGQPYQGLARIHDVNKVAADGKKYLAGEPRWTGEVRFIPEHLEDPLRWKRPRRIFVNSMSDLFHEKVQDEWIDRIFAVMALAPRHQFQVLTKRPERMVAYLRPSSELRGRVLGRAWEMLGHYDMKKYHHENIMERPFPLPNVWLGVSVEDQKTADERIPLLLQTPAAIRWVSAEPLLSAIDMSKWFRGHTSHDTGRPSIFGTTGNRSVLHRYGGAHLETSTADSGQQNRSASILGETVQGQKSRNEQFRNTPQELNELPSSDVYDSGGKTMECGRSSSSVDVSESARHSTSHAAKSQERNRDRQPSEESRTSYSLTEHDSRHQGIGENSSTEEDERRQVDSSTSSGNQKAMRPASYDEEGNSQTVRRMPELCSQHSGTKDLEIHSGISWVVIGGESGPGARPFDLRWARDTIAQCKDAGVKVFMKQLGSNPLGIKVPGKGEDPEHWPEDCRIREYPR